MQVVGSLMRLYVGRWKRLNCSHLIRVESNRRGEGDRCIHDEISNGERASYGSCWNINSARSLRAGATLYVCLLSAKSLGEPPLSERTGLCVLCPRQRMRWAQWLKGLHDAGLHAAQIIQSAGIINSDGMSGTTNACRATKCIEEARCTLYIRECIAPLCGFLSLKIFSFSGAIQLNLS